MENKNSNYIYRYKREHYKVFNLIITGSDSDVLKELSKHGNLKSQYIKNLIREDIKRNQSCAM